MRNALWILGALLLITLTMPGLQAQENNALDKALENLDNEKPQPDDSSSSSRTRLPTAECGTPSDS